MISEYFGYVMFSIGVIILIWLIIKVSRHIKWYNEPTILTAGIPNHLPQQIIIPPGPISREHQIILNNILKGSTELNYDVNDMSTDYIQKIIHETPENRLYPLQFLDDKYKDENCMICLDPLKNKTRPIVKLSCMEHYFHHSCYSTLFEDESKKRKIEWLFGQITNSNDMYLISCPFCRKMVTIDTIYIHFGHYDHVETVIEIEPDSIDIDSDIDVNEITPLLIKKDNQQNIL